MIAVREAEGGEYTALRRVLDPTRPPQGEPLPGELRLVAELDGRLVGAGRVRPLIHAPNGDTALVWLAVRSESRRRGVGSALEDRAAVHARALGKTRLASPVRDDDDASLGFFARRGYVEVDRMREAVLELEGREPEPVEAAEGYEIVPLGAEHERGIWEVARESDADIPSDVPFEELPFEAWRAANMRPGLLRQASFVALREGRVVGFALLEAFGEGGAHHAMTGVARDARGVGLATALKRAQVAAAHAAGLRRLYTQNDLANVAMRRVNEKLGYVRRCDWLHLVGPPIV